MNETVPGCVARALAELPTEELRALLPLESGVAPPSPPVEGDWSILVRRWLQSYADDGHEVAKERLRGSVLTETGAVRWAAWNTPEGQRWWGRTLEASAEAWTNKVEELAGEDLVPAAVHPDVPSPWGAAGVSEVPRRVLEWASGASSYIVEASCLDALPERAVETALGLWEPDGEGALTELPAAAEAARRLHQEADGEGGESTPAA